jgi:hypothetical protein
MRELSFSYAHSLKNFGQLGKPNWDAVIRVYDEAGNVIETHEQAGDFKEPWRAFFPVPVDSAS